MFAWLKRLFDRSIDPVYSCDLYCDKSVGSCAHVDGPLCDFPECSMLADYRQQKEGMTIAGDGAAELGKLMREQHKRGGPVAVLLGMHPDDLGA